MSSVTKKGAVSSNEFAEHLQVDMSGRNIEANNASVADSIRDPLLAYIIYALNSGARDNIRRAVLGFFSADVIHCAKDKLWAHCGNEILGPCPPRRGSTTKPKQDFELDDILDGIVLLDSHNRMPEAILSANDLHLIPRAHPEELSDISVAERLSRMEKKLENLQSSLDWTMLRTWI